VGETDPLDDPGKLGSGYSQSRWVAEKLLERARAQGLPVNIYRPGLTIGDSRHGAGDCDDAFWQLLRACVETGAGPDLNFRSFLVPVDYVSAAAVALSADPSLAGRNFHLVEPNTPSFSEMLRSARRFGFELEILSRDEWVAKVQSIVGERQFDEKLPYLLLIPSEFLDPFIGSLAGLLDEVDSHQTNAALAHVTTPSPQVNDALLHRCFAYLVETGFLPNPNAQGANLALQHEAAS
jgi:thioester reductase-like protein